MTVEPLRRPNKSAPWAGYAGKGASRSSTLEQGGQGGRGGKETARQGTGTGDALTRKKNKRKPREVGERGLAWGLRGNRRGLGWKGEREGSGLELVSTASVEGAPCRLVCLTLSSTFLAAFLQPATSPVATLGAQAMQSSCISWHCCVWAALCRLSR